MSNSERPIAVCDHGLLESMISEARQEALEEAAMLCLNWQSTTGKSIDSDVALSIVAEEIRALKDAETRYANP